MLSKITFDEYSIYWLMDFRRLKHFFKLEILNGSSIFHFQGPGIANKLM
jgi:hypothetical protein